ncbi:hypothetical protein DL768_002398 [Monosporascus sp. mg162]|nr:hypothetical protein DL768_002398 [Monosporascus sp. mg162]
MFERELRHLHREKDRIQDLWEDRHRLRSMEDAWRTEREELPKKQTELERLGGKMQVPLGALNKQAPLPKRIGINSKYILKILETIDDQAFSGGGSVMLIRPYKALSYYDEPIRQTSAELETKFLPQTSDPERLSMEEIGSSNQEGHAAELDEDEHETQDNVASEDDGHGESTSSLTAYQHLKCLIQFMDCDMRKKLACRDSDACKTVFFSDIWYLFKPGDEDFPPWRIPWNKEADRAEEQTPVILNCVYIDYDSKHLGPMTRKARIARFDGEKIVTSLEVFPLRYAGEKKGAATPQKPTFRERLIAHGKMFLDITSFKHMHYSGLTLDTPQLDLNHLDPPETSTSDETPGKDDLQEGGSAAEVRSTFRDKESKETHQADIVRGKALIILLHGAPGVAEMFKKPLHQITCGGLGTTAKEVEKALEMHFALVDRWGCVLLLDEADVFLAARSKEDFVRNGLVSVFLRVLEYYAGILFLTTNRVGDFDEAFVSRIHISLYYPQLDLASTEAIFKLNLDLIKERFTSKNRNIENGRHIRNACQTALALAEFRAQGGSYKRIEHVDAVVELKVEDLKTVSKAYLQFMQYLNEVRGKDVDRWAKELKIHARDMDVLLSQSGYEGKGKGRKGRDGGGPRLKTVPAASTHPGGTQVGMSSAGQSASLPAQSQPQAASQAPSAAPTGPISAPQHVPPFNAAPAGYYGVYYEQPQGFAAPPFMPAGTTQAPVAEPQAGPLPQSVQPQQNMGGWAQEAVATWYRQQAAQQQVPPQGPQPGQPPPFNMPNSTGNPSG